MDSSKVIYARVTSQGTAAAETAVCSKHTDNSPTTDDAAGPLVDCTGNEALACVVCGDAAFPVCPRCGGFIPNDATPGAYPGALSRTDNFTEVCSDCGTREAMEQFGGLQNLTGEARDWWAFQRDKAWHSGELKK